MAKATPQLDVLVLGQHPCAYLAAELLAVHHSARLHVAHSTIPADNPPDRLVIVNPQLFVLYKPLEKVRKKLQLTGMFGAVFLGDDAETRGEWRSKSNSPAVLVGCYSEIRKALAASAKDAGVKCFGPKSLAVVSVDEKGFEIHLDQHKVHPRAVLLAGNLSGENARLLALPEAFPSDVMRRYSFLRLRPLKRWSEQTDSKPLMPMSLDVAGKLTWAWMLVGHDEVQLAIEQPLEEIAHAKPAQVMRKWASTLFTHKFLKSDAVPLEEMESMDIPAAGALSREIVGNRTLLFGPAGGFYTACMEDLYPNCWSATFAVDAIRHALAQPHLQDALQPYRQAWGTTLGEYLRGPQQNLRFLLPLVYRNPVMSARMAESILQGKSVVR